MRAAHLTPAPGHFPWPATATIRAAPRIIGDPMEHRTNPKTAHQGNDITPAATHVGPTIGAGGTATDDWADARAGSGSEHPALLPVGETHLSVERTFSFVDLSGFTAYTRTHGPHAAVEMLGAFRQITRSVAAKRGVRVAKWLGDGAMLIGVEPSPVIALGAHLIHHFAGTDVRVRVGVATGTALLFEGDDYIGEPVNLAFKLCDAAQPGEMLAHCGDADLPDWVIPSGDVDVMIRGVGSISEVVRLQPKLITPAQSGAA
ncbi:MAG: adenylate/guanylate cyclase domain-containing protein [Acidimicrobiales bacterium]